MSPLPEDPEAPETFLENAPERIDEMALDLLDAFNLASLDPEAEQLFLLMLDSLRQAERFATLAVYKTRQARAKGA